MTATATPEFPPAYTDSPHAREAHDLLFRLEELLLECPSLDADGSFARALDVALQALSPHLWKPGVLA